ncbi:MAG: PPOX class F420-dependent oxidoreductase [Acidimicrobiia bacterium]
MNTKEALALLASGAETGKLATLRSDGSPHLVPVWFIIDGGDVVFQMSEESAKARNLARDPRAALTVEVGRPYNYVTAEGRVTVSDDLDDMPFFAGKIGARYKGADREEEFAERNGVPGVLLARLKINRFLSDAAY